MSEIPAYIQVLMNALEVAVEDIKDKDLGASGILRSLVDQVEPLARNSSDPQLIKLYLSLGIYRAVWRQSLEKAITKNFRERLEKPIPVPDPSESNETIEQDLSHQLKWIAMKYDTLSDFFGEISEDFYYEEAKGKLVPKYVDELQFPIVVWLLTKSFSDSIIDLKENVLLTLNELNSAFKGEDPIEDYVSILWQHIIELYMQQIAS